MRKARASNPGASVRLVFVCFTRKRFAWSFCKSTAVMGAQMEIVRRGGGTCKLDVEKKRFGLERFLFGEARVGGHFIEIPVFPNGELNVDDTRIMIGLELTEKDLCFSYFFQIGFKLASFKNLSETT